MKAVAFEEKQEVRENPTEIALGLLSCFLPEIETRQILGSIQY